MPVGSPDSNFVGLAAEEQDAEVTPTAAHSVPPRQGPDGAAGDTEGWGATWVTAWINWRWGAGRGKSICVSGVERVLTGALPSQTLDLENVFVLVHVVFIQDNCCRHFLALGDIKTQVAWFCPAPHVLHPPRSPVQVGAGSGNRTAVQHEKCPDQGVRGGALTPRAPELLQPDAPRGLSDGAWRPKEVLKVL